MRLQLQPSEPGFEMPFELGGKYGNEAFDAETGMRIRSLGARGPEIETHFWKVEISDRTFEFSTSVMEKLDGSVYNVLLTPDKLFLNYINNRDVSLLIIGRMFSRLSLKGFISYSQPTSRRPFVFEGADPPRPMV